MTIRRLVYLVLLAFILFHSSSAHATSCFIPGTEERILQNEIIFKGKAVSQQPFEDQKPKSDGYNKATVSTTFEVTTVYKGILGEKVDIIQMRDPWGDAGLQEGHEYIIFTDQHLKIYYCNPFVDLTAPNPHRREDALQILEKMKDELDDKQEDAEDDDTEEAFLEYGASLEKYQDYMRAEKLYGQLLDRQQKDGWDGAKSFDIRGKCTGKYAATDTTPQFLKDKSKFSPEMLTRYARTLIRQKRHAEALLPLCLADDVLGNAEARNLKILTLFHTGNRAEITGGPYDLSGAALGRLDVSGMNLSGWNFSKASITFIGSNVRFDGANFREAKVNGKISEASFKTADFEGADIRAQFDHSDFSGANLSKANLSGGPLTNLNFIGANLSGAQVYSDTANDIDFSGADMSGIKISEYFGGRSGQNILVKNANLENAVLGGVKLENIDFGTANLKNTSFAARTPFGKHYATSFRGSDLSKTSSIETATFDGAVYDCHTKFPSGFSFTAFLKPAETDGCETKKQAGILFDPQRERETRHKNFPLKGKVLGKDYQYNAGDNLDGARLTTYAKIPDEALRYKLIPTSIINGKGSPWEFSNIGRTQGTCDDEPSIADSIYKSPSIAIPDLSKMDLSFLEFYSSWLPNANLSRAKLMYADFSSGNFMGANFSGADMEGVSLFNSVADKADFSNANLQKTDLRLTRLSNANFTGANLAGAIYDINTMWPAGFDPVKAGALRDTPRNPYGQNLYMFPDVNKKYEKFKMSDLPANTELHGIGAYGRANNEAVDIYVTVKKKSVPIVLTLNGAYNLKWHVAADPGATVEAVIITVGEAAGIPSQIKVFNYQDISSGAGRSSTEKCGRWFDHYQDMMRAITGMNFTSYKGARDYSGHNSHDIQYQYIVD